MNLPPSEFSDFSLMELFRVEAENQVAVLNAGLLELERKPAATMPLEALMRAAHSLKGAARIVNLPVVARLAHALEDCFSAAQRGELQIGKQQVDVLLCGVDLFTQLSRLPESALASWEVDHLVEVEAFLADLRTLSGTVEKPVTSAMLAQGGRPRRAEPESGLQTTGGMLRLKSETVNRLLGMAGESLLESRRLQPFTGSMQRLKRLHADLSTTLDGLRELLVGQRLPERVSVQINELSDRVQACREYLTGRIEELDLFDRRTTRLSNRLYQETLQVRMRPFGDGMSRFPRMIRDLSRSLNKEVRLEIVGENTQVDREILEMLDAPLTHLLRNALDHGCEFPDERRRQSKPAESVVKLEARHSAGMLLLSVVDDGRGIDMNRLREAVVRRNLVALDVAEKLRESELMDFLFLPGFSTRENVTEVSGRGVGLDVVREMVKSVRGKIQVTSQPGKGTRFQMQLPISLTVLRALLVEVAGEPYAMPLAQIVETMKLPVAEVRLVAGRRHFIFKNKLIGLIGVRQLWGRPESKVVPAELCVVVLGDQASCCGLLVDDLLGESELVVQPLDARLGRVRDVSAAAMMEDGSPVLILDVEDLVLSVEKIFTGALLPDSLSDTTSFNRKRVRRILVVDDSITVRELQRKLLTAQGYLVKLAVDGVDGWNAVKAEDFDLIITDVDMPRMDGLELVSLIKRDPRLGALPVIIVSHKDREQDRQLGLAAGADEYLTKSGFRDQTLLESVRKLLAVSEK